MGRGRTNLEAELQFVEPSEVPGIVRFRVESIVRYNAALRAGRSERSLADRESERGNHDAEPKTLTASGA
ncbi:MAG TPA: hypothetical protein QF901_00480 [Gammaproteobacteria bacterium]|mgnify:CR=1 FL=1|jgi:hypothetical protein|nr:hypothetical protein [Gammaproteobacteria bacterium]